MPTKKLTVVTRPITSLSEPWHDEQRGECHDLGDIETFLKKMLTELSARKVGCFHPTTNDDKTVTLRAFASESDRDEWLASPGEHASLVLSEVTFSAGGASEDRYILSARVTSPLRTTVVKGGSNPMTFSYRSLWGGNADDHDTTPGTATVSVNGTVIEQLQMSLVSGQSYTVDVGPYLTEETNTVELTVRNAHGASRTFTSTVRTVTLDVGFDNFDQSIPRDAAWTLRIRATGAEALVHVAVDGVETDTATVTNSTREITIDPSGLLLPGVHTVKVWGENAAYGLTSEPVEACFIKKGAAAIAFASGTARSVKLYDTAPIPYFMLLPDKAGQTVDVTFTLVASDGTVLAAPRPQRVALDNAGASGIVDARFTADDAKALAGSPVTLTVKAGAVSDTVTIDILSSGTLLEAADECKVELLAAGRSNSDADAQEWASSYGGEVTCRVTRSPGFILGNGAGFDGEAYIIPAGEYITLSGFQPFGSDFSANGTRQGRTIEIEYELRDCTNSSAVAVSCEDNGTGFTIGAAEVSLMCGQKITTPVTPGRRVRTGFVIEGATRHCVNRLVDGTVTELDANVALLYINGVGSRVMDYANASWKQPTPKEIRIGCPDAAVALYAVRIYDKALTDRQMLGNFAFDTPGAVEKQEIARRNDILDSNGNVEFAKVRTALPSTPYKIWDMERMPTSKKDKVNTTTEFVNPAWDGDTEGAPLACASFICKNHPMVLDGTSSLGYPDPYKNFGSDYAGGQWTVEIGGQTVTIHSYSITPGIDDGETELVDKVNFASSEGLFNIITAHLYQKLLLGVSDSYPGVLSPAQAEQKADGGLGAVTYRQSLSGFPMTGWLRQADGAPRFLSIYNFINNKYQGGSLGVRPGEEIWEVDDNVTFFDELLQPGAWEDGAWKCRATTLYYARIPKKGQSGADYGTAKDASGVDQANAENSRLRRFHNWVYSCNPNIAERYRLAHGVYEPLAAPVTYGSVTYDRDTPEYRIAKFNTEHAEYIDKASAMLYFLTFTHILGIDSMAKNMSIRFISRGDKTLAQFVQRDSDTGFGYNNRGQFGFRPWLEWNDGYNPTTGAVAPLREIRDGATGAYSLDASCGEPVFNGRLSGLWDCVSRAWAADLQDLYSAMRSAGLTAAGMMALYDGFRDQWCEALYNVDAMGYVNTGCFDMAHGDKRESFRQFVTLRQAYMDSKYAPAATKSLVLRVWGNATGLVLRYAQPLYGAVKWGAGAVVSERQVKAGEPVYFPAPAGSMNETTVTIYGAELLTSVGSYTVDADGTITEAGLEGLSDGNVVVATGLENCNLLKELVLDYSERPANSQTMPLQGLSASNALETLVVRNCPGVSGTVQTGSTRLRELDLRDCPNVTAVSLKPSSTLASLQLGSGITQLVLDGMPSLAELTLQGYKNITRMSVTGCPKLKDRMKQLTEGVLSAQSSDRRLSYLALDPVAWTGASLALVEGLATVDECHLTGSITLATNVKPSFAARCGWIDLFGDTDSADAPLRIIVDPSQSHALSSVTIQGEAYVPATGLVTFKAIPNNANANAFRKVEWEVEASPANAASLDASTKAETAVVRVARTGSEDDATPPKFTIKLTITRNDGTTVEAQREIFCYRPKLKPGYFIYADGSWGPDYDLGIPEKTAVAYCFFVNPGDYTDCRVMALKSLGNQCWGPQPGDADGRTFDNDFPGMVAKTTKIDAYWTYKDLGSYEFPGGIYVDQANADNGQFAAFSSSHIAGYGLAMHSGSLTNTGKAVIPSEWSDAFDSDDVKGLCGQTLPAGMRETLCIIRHRNKVLDDSNVAMEHPTAIDGVRTEWQHLDGLLSSCPDSIAKAMFYPAASKCHAYTPSVHGITAAVTPQLGVHRWYLPTPAEMVRVFWSVHFGENYPEQEGGPKPVMENFLKYFSTGFISAMTCLRSVNGAALVDVNMYGTGAGVHMAGGAYNYFRARVASVWPVAAFDPTLEE